jgi:hypothetical protein
MEIARLLYGARLTGPRAMKMLSCGNLVGFVLFIAKIITYKME